MKLSHAAALLWFISRVVSVQLKISEVDNVVANVLKEFGHYIDYDIISDDN
jgi:hypothetical protein